MKSLQEIINDIQAEILKAGLENTINSGGCGVFAYYLSLALTKFEWFQCGSGIGNIRN